jgi:hypothetical protein
VGGAGGGGRGGAVRCVCPPKRQDKSRIQKSIYFLIFFILTPYSSFITFYRSRDIHARTHIEVRERVDSDIF